MSWINETLKGGEKTSRDVLMENFMTTVNMLRAEGYHDVEVYHVMLGLAGDMQHWPLFEYWCEIFLDWEDEMEVE